MGIHDRIQAGLGGAGLPTPIVEFDVGLCHLSDQVTMEEDKGDPIVVSDAGVVHGPVTTLSDRGVHQAFDLAHVLRLVDVASIGADQLNQ